MTDNSFDEFTPQFANEEEEALFATAVLGENARRFMTTDVGVYVLARAAEQIAQAKNELLKTPSWRKRKITNLQNQAKIAQNTIMWLNELLDDAEIAHDRLLKIDKEH